MPPGTPTNEVVAAMNADIVTAARQHDLLTLLMVGKLLPDTWFQQFDDIDLETVPTDELGLLAFIW